MKFRREVIVGREYLFKTDKNVSVIPISRNPDNLKLWKCKVFVCGRRVGGETYFLSFSPRELTKIV